MAYQWSDPARPGSLITASRISSLRNAIDSELLAAELLPEPWSWGNVQPGDRILALHLTSMRSAIQRLWNYKIRGVLPAWTKGAPGGESAGTSATPIHACDITDLRTWLDQYVLNAPPAEHGVDSKSYDPVSFKRPIIENDWVQDIIPIVPDDVVTVSEIPHQR